MAQVIRLYCPEKDRDRLNNFERTETQVIRTRYSDIHMLRFKIYSYCEPNNTFTGTGSFNGLRSFQIVNNNIIPNRIQLARTVHDIEWEIRNSNGEIEMSSYIHSVLSGMFTIIIPQMSTGHYTLSVTYNYNYNKYSRVFPIVVTN